MTSREKLTNLILKHVWTYAHETQKETDSYFLTSLLLAVPNEYLVVTIHCSRDASFVLVKVL